MDEGPLIPIAISASEEYIKEGSRLGAEFPPPVEIDALVDTGSNFTMVSHDVVERCKLRATGFQINVASLGRLDPLHEHAAWIRFPNTGLTDFREIPVAACDILQVRKRPYKCIIGRDILRNWLLTYDGNGIVSIQGWR